METLPWEDGDPPDHQRWGAEEHEVGAMVSVKPRCASRSEAMGSVGWVAGDRVGVPSASHYGGPCTRSRVCGMPGRGREAHSVGSPYCDVVRIGSTVRMQLDPGLTVTTKHSSHSRIWRMSYFLNDAPFLVRNCSRFAELCQSTAPTSVFEIA